MFKKWWRGSRGADNFESKDWELKWSGEVNNGGVVSRICQSSIKSVTCFDGKDCVKAFPSQWVDGGDGWKEPGPGACSTGQGTFR